MKLIDIIEIEGTIEVVTGIHIGAGNDEIKIGGIDNPVIKNPLTNEPYIPGSSLKGKVRTMLEWYLGTIDSNSPTTINRPDGNSDIWKNNITDAHKAIVKIFGNGSTIKNDDIAKEIGPTRISFFDCFLERDNAEKLIEQNALTEAKTEVVIDRFKGAAKKGGLRQMERVPAGAEFEFRLTYMVFDESDKENFKYIPLGLKLIEMVGIGGSTSRGYGKIKFKKLKGMDNYTTDGKLKEISEILGSNG